MSEDSTVDLAGRVEMAKETSAESAGSLVGGLTHLRRQIAEWHKTETEDSTEIFRVFDEVIASAEQSAKRAREENYLKKRTPSQSDATDSGTVHGEPTDATSASLAVGEISALLATSGSTDAASASGGMSVPVATDTAGTEAASTSSAPKPLAAASADQMVSLRAAAAEPVVIFFLFVSVLRLFT